MSTYKVTFFGSLFMNLPCGYELNSKNVELLKSALNCRPQWPFWKKITIPDDEILQISYSELDEFLKKSLSTLKADPDGNGYWYLYVGGGEPCYIRKLWKLFKEKKI